MYADKNFKVMTQLGNIPVDAPRLHCPVFGINVDSFSTPCWGVEPSTKLNQEKAYLPQTRLLQSSETHRCY